MIVGKKIAIGVAAAAVAITSPVIANNSILQSNNVYISSESTKLEHTNIILAESATRYGNTTYYSSGGSSTKYGNSRYYSGGGSATDYGNSRYYSGGGSSTVYGNTTVDGLNYGVGFKGVTGNNLTWKVAYEVVDFDDLSLTSTTGNKITADLDTKEVNFSLGYQF